MLSGGDSDVVAVARARMARNPRAQKSGARQRWRVAVAAVAAACGWSGRSMINTGVKARGWGPKHTHTRAHTYRPAVTHTHTNVYERKRITPEDR